MAKKATEGEALTPQQEKLKALQAAMSKIEKDYGKGSVMKLGDKTSLDVETVSTGSISLDKALGVGGACTSWLGVWLAQLSPGWLVMLAAAAVIAYSGITMFRKALKAPKQSIGSSDANAPVPEPPALSSKKG